MPVAHIIDVRKAPPIDLSWRDLRLLGTYLKGRSSPASSESAGASCSTRCARSSCSIAIELTHQFYDDLVLEVEDPERAIRDLEEARRQTLKRK